MFIEEVKKMKKKMSSKVISLFIMMVMMLSSIIMPFGENIGMLKQLVIHAEDNKTSSEELYREVLDMYYNNISTEWIYYCAGYYGSGVSYDYYNPFQGTITNGIGINSGVGYAEVSDIWWRHSKSNNLYSSGTQPLANTGYQFVDINSDGIDELLIGVISDYYGYGNYGSNVYDLYTIYNGKIIHIANSSDRCAFSVGNGVVITDGSGGGLLHGTEVNRIENGKLVPFEMYRYDAWEDKDNPYFFSDEIVLKQDGYYDSDNWKHITEKEYNSDIRSKYTLYSEIEFVPFSDYKPSKIFKAPDWKRAYIDYIINNKPDSSLAWYINCSLVCIDEDDIPELCIVNSNSGETTILTFKDSNVTSTDFDKSKIASGTKTCDFYSIVDEINSYYYPADYSNALANDYMNIQEHISFFKTNEKEFVGKDDPMTLSLSEQAQNDDSALYYKLYSDPSIIFMDDAYHEKMVVQMVITELLCSEEVVDSGLDGYLDGMDKVQNLFINQIHQLIENSGLVLGIAANGYDRDAELKKLLKLPKDSDEFKIAKEKWFNNALNDLEIDKATKILKNAGLFVKATETVFNDALDLYKFCEACASYQSADEAMKKALKDLTVEMGIEGLKLDWRTKKLADEFVNQIDKIVSTSDDKYADYVEYLVKEDVKDFGKDELKGIVFEGITLSIKLAFPEIHALLVGLEIGYKIGLKVFEAVTKIGDRALERDILLNLLIIQEASSKVVTLYGSQFIKNQNSDSVVSFEYGFNIYKKIRYMTLEHAYNYAALQKEKDYHLMNNLLIQQLSMLFWQCHGEASNLDAIRENQADILVTIFGEHMGYSSYYVKCPVDVAVYYKEKLVAQLSENGISYYDEEGSLTKFLVYYNEEDSYSSKYLFVPNDYDVVITGQSDGKMKLSKTTFSDVENYNTVTFTNIPVTSGSTYTEIVENGTLTAISADLDTDGIIDEKIYPVASEEDCIEYEGEYHDLSWYLTTDGKFVINGTGDMHDLIYVNSGIFTVQTVPPWHENRDKIESIIIKEGITSIGDFVFYDCVNLKSVSVPSSVTVIGKGSFSKCENLKSVTIPNNTTDILAGAFSECTNLSRIDIPNSVKLIGDSAFLNTKWLYEKQKENPFVIVNGILVDATKCSGNITIPNNVTSIGYYAFDRCLDVTSVSIPSSVVAIELGAFSNCTNLRSVTISGGVKTIESKVFFNCTSLERVNIPDSVTGIESVAFYYCSSLTDIVIPSRCSYIEYHAFMGCDSLKSIKILNPACEIYEDEYTISSQSTIYGYSNSTAQSYAEKNERNFVLLTPDSQKICKGDITGDNSVNILDVITINKAILGKETIPNEQLKNIDFNGNGKPDSEESLILLKYIVGLISVLP